VIAITENAIDRAQASLDRTVDAGAQTNTGIDNPTQEISMSTRPSLLALAAIATIATAGLASTAASAAQFTVNHPSSHVGVHLHPYPICSWGCSHDHERDEREDEHRELGWNHHPYYGAPVGVASVGASVAPAIAPAPAGSCLTKQELPDGSALFRDLCTHEQAESVLLGVPVAR
jgi:hypothetical protein